MRNYTMATKTLEQIDASLTRWKSRLRRAMTAIDKLEKQRKRLAKATAVRSRVDREGGWNAERAILPEATAVRVSVPAHPTVDSETTLGTVPPPLAKQMPFPQQGDGIGLTKPAPVTPADDDIPAFLRRRSDGGLEATRQRSIDADAAERIKRDQAEAKRKKAQGRIATMRAKKSGETRKMPLTGRAALAAIRSAE
jgi:hypothetical protein